MPFSQAAKDSVAGTHVQVARLWTFDRSSARLITLDFQVGSLAFFLFSFRYLIDGLLRVRLDHGRVTLTLSVTNLYIYLGDFLVVLFAVEVFFLFDP